MSEIINRLLRLICRDIEKGTCGIIFTFIGRERNRFVKIDQGTVFVILLQLRIAFAGIGSRFVWFYLNDRGIVSDRLIQLAILAIKIGSTQKSFGIIWFDRKQSSKVGCSFRTVVQPNIGICTSGKCLDVFGIGLQHLAIVGNCFRPLRSARINLRARQIELGIGRILFDQFRDFFRRLATVLFSR